MPTLRRILKYTPVVLLGLLVVAWAVGQFRVLTLQCIYSGRITTAYLAQRHLGISSKQIDNVDYRDFDLTTAPKDEIISKFFRGWHVPVVVLMTAILPLAIGPFLSFRFRLWHYLAYTALVAVELAYCLR